jgi:membrane protein involved in colicin uptake
MPCLSRELNCVFCASPEHKAPDCPHREISAKAAAAKPKSDANKAKSDAAKARAAAKRDANKAKSDAAKARAAAKRDADRAIVVATKARQIQEDAWHNAVYVALNAVAPMPKTAGSYKNSRWAVVADVCVRCERPSPISGLHVQVLT